MAFTEVALSKKKRASDGRQWNDTNKSNAPILSVVWHFVAGMN